MAIPFEGDFMYDIIVVGGGPSGMMAAITAAKNGKKILLIEKNKELGKKLLVTGGGRCNITNLKTTTEFMAHVNNRFLYKSLSRFGPNEIFRVF